MLETTRSKFGEDKDDKTGSSRLAATSHPVLLGVALSVLVAACGPSQSPGGKVTSNAPSAMYPELRTAADSLAYVLVEGHGGLSTWNKVRYLRYNFETESGGKVRLLARHLWDRYTGDYRLEWFRGQDTTLVALFNSRSRDGRVFANGVETTTEKEALLASAYRRFINDMYWLMAPLKVFDEGVVRNYAADSSTSEVGVLALSFQDVGLTPGDRYWVSVDRSTGLVRRWSYILEGRQDQPPSTFKWIDYRSFDTPAGTVRLSERKERLDGSSATLTDGIRLPSRVASNVFTDPDVMLE